MNKSKTNRKASPKYSTSFRGPAKGTVIGDNNLVYQHFHSWQPQLPSPVSPPPPRPFWGRTSLAKELMQLLVSPTCPSVLALYGIPGIGKSALVRFLMSQPDLKEEFSEGCFWVDVEQSRNSSRTALEYLLILLGQEVEPLTGQTEPNLLEQARLLLNGKRAVLVLDNLNWNEAAKGLLGLAGTLGLVILFTTRSTELAYDLAERVFEIKPLEKEESEKMLRHLAQLVQEQVPGLPELLKKAGGNPFLISAIGRELRIKKKATYKQETIWKLVEELQDSAHQLSLAFNEISYEQILNFNFQALSAAAQKALKLLCLSGSGELPGRLIELLFEGSTGQNLVMVSLEELLNLGFLEEAGDTLYRLPEVIWVFGRKISRSDHERDQIITMVSFCYEKWVIAPSKDNSQKDYQLMVNHLLAFMDFLLLEELWGPLSEFTQKIRGNLATATIETRDSTFYGFSVIAARSSTMHFNECFVDKTDFRLLASANLYIYDSFLNRCRLSGSHLGSTYIYSTSLFEIDFRGMFGKDFYFYNCIGRSLDFRGCLLKNLYIYASNIVELNLEGATINSLYLMDKSRTIKIELRGVNIGEIYLNNSILADADFNKGTIGELLLTEDYLLINVEGLDSVAKRETRTSKNAFLDETGTPNSSDPEASEQN